MTDCNLEPGTLKDFSALKLTIASPEEVMFWSHGEVTRAETINYRTHRPEPAGLMCEKIFGPVKSYQCYCGKYRKAKFKGIVCDKCGVEVTHKSVRRERMGHIKLASPVVHIWYIHGVPNKLATLLDLPQKKLQACVYFARYMVTEVEESGRNPAIKQVRKTFDKRISDIKSEMDKAISVERKKFDKQIASASKAENKETIELNREKLEHERDQGVAKLRNEYKTRQDEVRSEYDSLEGLINRLMVGEIISEEEKLLLEDYAVDFYTLKMGADAVKTLLENLDLSALSKTLHEELEKAKLQQRAKMIQRLRMVDGMVKGDIKPTWFITETLPVLPPDLRPIVPIAGGRFASSDLNDLYRRVINRNNRLKRLIDLGAPEVILRNERRMLQEAVDALIDNNHRPSRPVLNTRRLPLKSLSDIFRGKSGRFRQNLLGKRVDYSGRAVIVTGGVDYSLRQCGVPKHMALELFKPFVIHKLLERGLASNVRNVRFIIEEETQEVWDILDEVIKDYPVLLNRAPTLHKQGIQAFYPVLVEGDAIRIPPMICDGYNADFDGDMMAIHVPLSDKAKEECKTRMMATHNILRTGDGQTVIKPHREIIQGMYYMTTISEVYDPVNTVFADFSEVITAYQQKQLELRTPIKVMIDDEVVETTAGRILFNEVLPKDFRFVNQPMNKKALGEITSEVFEKYGADETIDFLDRVNRKAFQMATTQGFSPGISDCVSPPGLEKRIAELLERTSQLVADYEMGLISEFERVQEFQKMWAELMEEARKGTIENMSPENPIRAAIEAKSRWDESMITQVSAFKGIIQDVMGRTIELPVTHNFVQGLTEFEYFISCRGARKGLIDTALKTAESGYLTRRLVDVAHDSVIREEDCGSKEGMPIYREDDKYRSEPFKKRLIGRYLAKKVTDPKTKKEIAKRDAYITDEIAGKIDASGLESVSLRSPITCHTPFGLCAKCYGIDHGTKQHVEIGRPVGVLAAQSLGEPSTQLVLRTFHKGGVVGTDITHGLPRVEELFEARVPKGAAVIAEIDGKVSIEKTEKDTIIVSVINETPEVFNFSYPNDKSLMVGRKKGVREDEVLFKDAKGKEVKAPTGGKITVNKETREVVLEGSQLEQAKYEISLDEECLVKNGDQVKAGTLITQGNIDPKILVQTKGLLEAQRYTINHIQKVYSEQAASVADVHIEIIVAQMARLVEITDPGDTNMLIGEFKDKYAILNLNKELEAAGKSPVRFRPRLIGVKAASLKKDSFLSAASFQEQVRVLSDAAVVGKIDYLRGLKENVIIGKLVPVGTHAKLAKDLEEVCYGTGISVGEKTTETKKEEK